MFMHPHISRTLPQQYMLHFKSKPDQIPIILTKTLTPPSKHVHLFPNSFGLLPFPNQTHIPPKSYTHFNIPGIILHHPSPPCTLLHYPVIHNTSIHLQSYKVRYIEREFPFPTDNTLG